MAERALEGIRIIECGHLASAAYAAKLMADMGAEVIKIEEPGGGDQARQRGPYPGHVPHPEKSGLFLYLGMQELAPVSDRTEPVAGRVRSPGGGRKPLTHHQPTLPQAVDALVEPTSRGDPQSPLRWTCKSVRQLAAELNAQGYGIGRQKVADLLYALGYSLQANCKTKEGVTHPDRHAQFEYLNAQVQAFQQRGQPVVSADTKKQELGGEFKNGRREWRPKGEPEAVRVYDFAVPSLGKAIPYDVYDRTANTGWISGGIDHDTAEFAVATLRRWWRHMGLSVYPTATNLLITADGGGSNGSRCRLWKVALQRLADERGLCITVCHFPPGTSKWNKIEHRMFSHIAINWRGQPLTSHEVIVNLIANTTTQQGLHLQAALDTNRYPTGIEEVLNFTPAASFRRETYVEIFDRPNNTLYEAVVDLVGKTLRSFKSLPPGTQPAVFSSEGGLIIPLVRNDREWIQAMRRRGIDPHDVVLDIWAGGHLPITEDREGNPVPENTRIVRVLSFFEGDLPNPYCRPIEGVVVAVDMNRLRVLQVTDTGIRPLSLESGEPDPDSDREPLKPLHVRQNRGPSYQVNGYQVNWQNWRFRFALHSRDGLVLYTISYLQGGRVRSIAYCIGLSEVWVLYGLPDINWVWRAAFDEGECSPVLGTGLWRARSCRLCRPSPLGTTYNPAEMYAAGQYPYQGRVGEGLPHFSNGESIVNKDIVLWYSTGLTHHPEVEEYPVMATTSIGFRFTPDGFFSRSPVLDVPLQRKLRR